jgi:hypoxanthine-guanine phosphoribosyltransferase
MIKSRVRQLAQNIYNDFKGQTLNVFVVMTGAYKFATDLVKYIKKINETEESKVAMKPYFFKIDKNNHPHIFEDPVVS